MAQRVALECPSWASGKLGAAISRSRFGDASLPPGANAALNKEMADRPNPSKPDSGLHSGVEFYDMHEVSSPAVPALLHEEFLPTRDSVRRVTLKSLMRRAD